MSTEPRMQLDDLEQLKAVFDLPCKHDFLAEYVTEVCRPCHEEEVFRRLAFGEGSTREGSSVGSISRLYAGLSAEHRAQLRRGGMKSCAAKRISMRICGRACPGDILYRSLGSTRELSRG